MLEFSRWVRLPQSGFSCKDFPDRPESAGWVRVACQNRYTTRHIRLTYGGRATMRFFNTEGPNRAEDHYCLPPLERWDLAEILMLIGQKKYFLLHAPRQRRLRRKPVGGYSISPYHSQWVEIWRLIMASVTLELSEALAQRANQAARVMSRPVSEVLTALLEGALPALDDVPLPMRTELIEMTWSSDQALAAITHLTLSPPDQARLVELSAPVHPLSPEEHQELRRLRERYGEITLRKARAFALLSLRSGKKLLNNLPVDGAGGKTADEQERGGQGVEQSIHPA